MLQLYEYILRIRHPSIGEEDFYIRTLCLGMLASLMERTGYFHSYRRKNIRDLVSRIYSDFELNQSNIRRF